MAAHRKETSHTWLQELRNAEPESPGWRYLLDSYGPFVRKILTDKGLQDAAADDVTQNVLAIVVRKLPEFERSYSGSFRSWMRKITVNCLRDYLKSKQFKTRAVGGDEMKHLVAVMEDPRSDFTRTWNEEHARHVLDELLKAVAPEFSTKTIEIFRRLAIKEQPVEDVAIFLGTTPNACFIARSRVLKRLKTVWRELFGEDEGLFESME